MSRAVPAGAFDGKVALVTGAGSGIGAALSRALVAAGARVVCSDLDPASAAATASGLGERASAVGLDVTDAAAVEQVVAGTVAEHGRLDLLFNNAGICFGGETEHLTLEQWNLIIDVNLRGVVHGVAAAYPRMIAQGSGHIVNTASMGGLTPGGLLTSYVATKHAVVGLSLALRSEASAKGVGVTVVCPGAVETPILDKGSVDDFVGRDYYLRGQGLRRALDPDELAAAVLRGVAADAAVVIEPRSARVQWRVARLFPGLLWRSTTSFVTRQRRWQAERTTAAR